MEQEQHDSQEEAPEVAADGEDVFEHYPVAVTSEAFLFILDLSLNFTKLNLDVRMIC